MLIMFFMVSVVKCQLESPTDCHEKCTITSKGDFDDDCASKAFRNLSLCMVKHNCFSIGSYAKMLQDHYCYNSSCFVTCEGMHNRIRTPYLQVCDL